MAKLTVRRNPEQAISLMDEGLKTSAKRYKAEAEDLKKRSFELIDIKTIMTAKPFINLFKFKKERVERIAQSMKDDGYDITKPCIVWRERGILLDGHHKLAAAKKTKIDTIPVIFLSFKSEKDAILYASKSEFSSRNAKSDDELLNYVQDLNFEYLPGKGALKEKLSKMTGCSETKIIRLLHVIKNASAEQLKLIDNKDLSINNIYNSLKGIVTPPKSIESPSETVTPPKSIESPSETVTPPKSIESPSEIVTPPKSIELHDEHIAIHKLLSEMKNFCNDIDNKDTLGRIIKHITESQMTLEKITCGVI